LAKLSPVDLVLIEGYKGEPHPKLEVHRGVLGAPLLAPGDPAIMAVASDIALPAATVPVVHLDDVERIVDVLIRHATPRDEVLAQIGQA
jgi:molybdopterin-guanine dinucleotide biosynthesis protein B